MNSQIRKRRQRMEFLVSHARNHHVKDLGFYSLDHVPRHKRGH